MLELYYLNTWKWKKTSGFSSNCTALSLYTNRLMELGFKIVVILHFKTSSRIVLMFIVNIVFLQSASQILAIVLCVLFYLFLIFNLRFWLPICCLQAFLIIINNIHTLHLNLKAICTRHETIFYMFLSLKQKDIYSEIRYAYSIFLIVRPAPIWRTSYNI
jgi:hypothetical protein